MRGGRLRPTPLVLLFVASLLVMTLPTPVAAQACVTVGESVHCGTGSAANRVGRNLIFNQGRAGVTLGDLVEIERDGKPRFEAVLPRPPEPRPRPRAAAPGGFIDLQRGKDFGAFEFPLRNRLGATLSGARSGRLGPTLPAFRQ